MSRTTQQILFVGVYNTSGFVMSQECDYVISVACIVDCAEANLHLYYTNTTWGIFSLFN